MKILLSLIICSQVHTTCMPPYPWPETFDNSYDCMMFGYQESQKKMQEIEKSSTITDDGLPWSDDKIKCTHCDERGCVVSYSIEASVNSKVNIWGGASNDISGTKYKCKKCGHRWKSDN